MIGLLKKLFSTSGNAQLSEALKEGALLVDVRTTSEFSSGSVKGAINIPLDKVQSQVSKLKSHRNIIVFCRSGGRSSQAKSILEKNGFQNVINGGSWENVKQAVGQ